MECQKDQRGGYNRPIQHILVCPGRVAPFIFFFLLIIWPEFIRTGWRVYCTDGPRRISAACTQAGLDTGRPADADADAGRGQWLAVAGWMECTFWAARAAWSQPEQPGLMRVGRRRRWKFSILLVFWWQRTWAVWYGCDCKGRGTAGALGGSAVSRGRRSQRLAAE